MNRFALAMALAITLVVGMLVGRAGPALGAVVPVDANSATQAQLQTVAGVGPVIAARIVEERRKGPYRDMADLERRVKGIGEAKARRMAAGGLTVGSGRARATAQDKPVIIEGRPAIDRNGGKARSGARPRA